MSNVRGWVKSGCEMSMGGTNSGVKCPGRQMSGCEMSTGVICQGVKCLRVSDVQESDVWVLNVREFYVIQPYFQSILGYFRRSSKVHLLMRSCRK